MDLNTIRKLPKIFQQGDMYYGYEYHRIPGDQRSICLEYNLFGDAQFLYHYQLREDQGIFLFDALEFRGYSIGYKGIDAECKVAGFTEEEAVEFMIAKILELPKKNTHMTVDVEKLEKALRKVLAPEPVCEDPLCEGGLGDGCNCKQ